MKNDKIVLADDTVSALLTYSPLEELGKCILLASQNQATLKFEEHAVIVSRVVSSGYVEHVSNPYNGDPIGAVNRCFYQLGFKIQS